MRLIFVTALIALSAWSAAQTAPQTGDGIIKGIVLWPETKQPIEGVTINLRRGDVAEFTQNAVTDGEGRFSFRNLAIVSYNLTAQRDGYIAKVPFGLSTLTPLANAVVRLTETEKTADLQLSLIPGAAVNGRVIDADGRPAPNVQVTAAQNRYGQLVTIPGRVVTNDRGEYRIWGLPPGDYYLRAQVLTRAGTVPVSISTYFPSASTTKTAVPLSLRAKTEMTADITLLRASPVRISGRVVLPETNVQGRARFFLVNQEDAAATSIADMTVENLLNPTRRGTVGTGGVDAFQVLGKQPGLYELLYLLETVPYAPEAYTARMPLEVRSGDIDGIVITVSRTTELEVRFITGGDAELERQIPGRLDLSLRDRYSPFRSLAADANSLGPFSSRPSLAGNTAGPVARTFYRVSEGEYVLDSPIRFFNGYIADIRQGPMSILDDGVIRVGKEPPAPVEIIVKRPGATVQGIVRDAAGQPVDSGNIVAVPDGARRQNPVLYQRTFYYAFAMNGQFTIRGLTPGRYKLFSWEDNTGGAEEIPEFIAKYERFGREITVTAGATLTDINVTRIRTGN